MLDRSGYRKDGLRWSGHHVGLAAVAGLVLTIATPARADNPPPPPPPGFEGAAPQPQPPPPTYAPPPGYGQPPVGGYYAAPSYGPPVLGPTVLDWEEGEPVRPGYHPDTRVRKGLVVGGAVTFGSTYLLTALISAAVSDACSAGGSSCSEVVPLFIPAIGPFIAIGTLHPITTAGFFLALDGIAQSAGIAMFIFGLASPRTVQVRNDISKPFLRPVPMMVGGTSPGVGFVGKF